VQEEEGHGKGREGVSGRADRAWTAEQSYRYKLELEGEFGRLG
jgi:hypothetical protein